MRLGSIFSLREDIVDRDGRTMKKGTLVQVMSIYGSREEGVWYTVASNPSFMGSRAEVQDQQVTLVRE